jgi:hypothetical protein
LPSRSGQLNLTDPQDAALEHLSKGMNFPRKGRLAFQQVSIALAEMLTG